MATNQEKEELMAALKFTPCTYRIELGNYGGEVYAGRVDRKVYDYFKKRKLDIEEYNSDWDNELNVPEEFQPFPPGSPYECDDLIHASGATMNDGNLVQVYNENNDLVWECALDFDALSDEGIECCESDSFSTDEIADGDVIFWGAQGEKGLLFGGEFELKSPFDPKKLSFSYANADGWYLCNDVEYDGDYIDNNDLSTTGKWGENKWILGGDEEVYDPEEGIEEGEENGGVGWPTRYWADDSEKVTFKFKKHKPVHSGWYECNWAYGTTYGKLYWNGSEFVDFEYNKEQSIDQKGIVSWTGLNWDTSDWTNCPQPKEEWDPAEELDKITEGISDDYLQEAADALNETFADELSQLTEEDIPKITGEKDTKKVKASWPF